jgi:hypothetical protein
MSAEVVGIAVNLDGREYLVCTHAGDPYVRVWCDGRWESLKSLGNGSVDVYQILEIALQQIGRTLDREPAPVG